MHQARARNLELLTTHNTASILGSVLYAAVLLLAGGDRPALLSGVKPSSRGSTSNAGSVVAGCDIDEPWRIPMWIDGVEMTSALCRSNSKPITTLTEAQMEHVGVRDASDEPVGKRDVVEV
jgi:hypothetical protein